MHPKNKITALLLITMLTISILGAALPAVYASTESLTTDKTIYVVKWIGVGRTATPYVDITINVSSMVVGHTYRLNITRWASVYNGLENRVVDQYIRQIAEPKDAQMLIIEHLVPGISDITSDDPTGVRHIAGTYNLTLDDQTAGTMVKTANFGIWGLTSNLYNFCDEITAVGGGMNVSTIVAFTDNGTSILPAGKNIFPVNYTVGDYGLFTAVGGHFVKGVNATSGDGVSVTMTTFTPITPGITEVTTSFRITHLLEVSVWTDMAEYQRTQTITIYAQVTKQSGVADTNAIINAWISTWTLIAQWIDNNWTTVTPDPLSVPITGSTNWTMTATPGIFSAKYKLRYNDEIGNFTISVFARDPCGNNGTGSIWTSVIPAVLAKVIWVQPKLSIDKSDTAFIVFNVTYPDGSTVELNLTASKVLVLKPDGTNTTATVTKVAAGEYNATYFIPPTDPNGSFRFLIQANALIDNVTVTWLGLATNSSKGPADDNYSDYFVVGPFALLVDVITDKPAYAKGETVLITATARYKDGSYLSGAAVSNWYTWPHTVVTGSKVWVDIYWPNGTWHKKINLIFTPPTPALAPRWTGTYPTTNDYPAGIYMVNCTADDTKGNVGYDTTTFLLAGLLLQPSRGTVPPDWSPYLSYNATTGIVSAQIYSAGTKTLGTDVIVSASPNTLPNNTAFILTIEAADIPADTVAWYSNPVNLNISASDLANKGIILAIVTTETDGSLLPITIVWPSMPNASYTLLAIKNGTATPWTKAKALASSDFIVDPGLVIAPNVNGTSAFTTGNTLCNVTATGFPADAIWKAPSGSIQRMAALLLNGTDALVPYALQSWGNWFSGSYNKIPVEWRFDGTATMLQAFSGSLKVNPAFILPVLQPGVYQVDLLAVKVNQTGGEPAAITSIAKATDYIAVYGVTGELIDMIRNLNATVLDIQGNVATIRTNLGQVNMTVSDIMATVLSINDSVVTIQTLFGPVNTKLDEIEAKIENINGTVAKISTTVGKVQTDLADIGGKVTTINGKVATIDTNLGTVAADVSALKGIVTSISGTVTTVSTTLGTVSTDVKSVKDTVSGLGTATYASAGLAAVAAIAAILAVIQITRKVYMPTK